MPPALQRLEPRPGPGTGAVRRAGGGARCRGRACAVAVDAAAGEGRESGLARDERPRCPPRCGRQGGVARGRGGTRRRDAGPARRRGRLRRGAGHERRIGLAGQRAARALSPDRGSRAAAVAVIPHPPLRLDGVSFAYGTVPALAGLSFSIAPGERAALLGRHGAGKSTVVRLVAGLERPDAGKVWVGDWDTRDCAPERLARRGRSVFQHADQQLFASTVREDVRFAPRAPGGREEEGKPRTDDALDDLRLTPHAAPHPHHLPPALPKLAALAGALALEPALLVLDEPTIGLDRALCARVSSALLERSAAGVARSEEHTS